MAPMHAATRRQQAVEAIKTTELISELILTGESKSVTLKLVLSKDYNKEKRLSWAVGFY